MKGTTAVALPVRRLFRSISNHFVAIHTLEVCTTAENHNKH